MRWELPIVCALPSHVDAGGPPPTGAPAQSLQGGHYHGKRLQRAWSEKPSTCRIWGAATYATTVREFPGASQKAMGEVWFFSIETPKIILLPLYLAHSCQSQWDEWFKKKMARRSCCLLSQWPLLPGLASRRSCQTTIHAHILTHHMTMRLLIRILVSDGLHVCAHVWMCLRAKIHMRGSAEAMTLPWTHGARAHVCYEDPLYFFFIWDRCSVHFP